MTGGQIQLQAPWQSLDPRDPSQGVPLLDNEAHVGLSQNNEEFPQRQKEELMRFSLNKVMGSILKRNGSASWWTVNKLRESMTANRRSSKAGSILAQCDTTPAWTAAASKDCSDGAVKQPKRSKQRLGVEKLVKGKDVAGQDVSGRKIGGSWQGDAEVDAGC